MRRIANTKIWRTTRMRRDFYSRARVTAICIESRIAIHIYYMYDVHWVSHRYTYILYVWCAMLARLYIYYTYIRSLRGQNGVVDFRGVHSRTANEKDWQRAALIGFPEASSLPSPFAANIIVVYSLCFFYPLVVEMGKALSGNNNSNENDTCVLLDTCQRAWETILRTHADRFLRTERKFPWFFFVRKLRENIVLSSKVRSAVRMHNYFTEEKVKTTGNGNS